MKYTVMQGDCLESLKSLGDESVNCCVTSPPYWGLRDYGESDQLGLEETPEEYVANMVKVFSEVKRVLTKDGTLWLNLGDSYVGKSLVGIPWGVAFALQADGWHLRQDIIWHKPNAMPESVTDRCTKAHEYVFLLTKSSEYYYDHEAIKEKAKGMPEVRDKNKEKYMADYPNRERFSAGERVYGEDGMANKRSVWSVNTKPYKEAHFATFPPKLIRPCIQAGCPKGGIVLDPFGGSGTTAEVANGLGRDAILCELNPEYCELIEKRMALTQMEMFA